MVQYILLHFVGIHLKYSILYLKRCLSVPSHYQYWLQIIDIHPRAISQNISDIMRGGGVARPYRCSGKVPVVELRRDFSGPKYDEKATPIGSANTRSHFGPCNSLKMWNGTLAGLNFADIWLCTSNSVFLRVVVTNSPQLIKVRDLNGCHGNQTTF